MEEPDLGCRRFSGDRGHRRDIRARFAGLLRGPYPGATADAAPTRCDHEASRIGRATHKPPRRAFVSGGCARSSRAQDRSDQAIPPGNRRGPETGEGRVGGYDSGRSRGHGSLTVQRCCPPARGATVAYRAAPRDPVEPCKQVAPARHASALALCLESFARKTPCLMAHPMTFRSIAC